jgi:predicted GIY-YIG superfamily endonuclease
MDCLVCGEKKSKQEFKYIMYFSQYKKKKITWCQDCQKMYLAMKKEKEAETKLQAAKVSYLVSFQ